MVDLVPMQDICPPRRRKLFRFEHTWLREDGCEDIIKEAWNTQHRGTAMFRLMQKIKQCRIKLLTWSQSQIRATPRKIAAKKAQLFLLEQQPRETYNGREVNALRRELAILMEKEEIHWRQRSRVAWLREGDRNTKYYHACATQRKKTNTISGIMDSEDVWQTEKGAIGVVVENYFNSLFATTNPATIEEVVQHVETVVSPRMNGRLLQPFSSEEVKFALFQMSPSKAPGPDGMTALFFQKFWHVVGFDVTCAVLDFLNIWKQLRPFPCG